MPGRPPQPALAPRASSWAWSTATRGLGKPQPRGRSAARGPESLGRTKATSRLPGPSRPALHVTALPSGVTGPQEH